MFTHVSLQLSNQVVACTGFLDYIFFIILINWDLKLKPTCRSCKPLYHFIWERNQRKGETGMLILYCNSLGNSICWPLDRLIITSWSARRCPWNFLKSNFGSKKKFRGKIDFWREKKWNLEEEKVLIFESLSYPRPGYSRVLLKNVCPFGTAIRPAIAKIHTNAKSCIL